MDEAHHLQARLRKVARQLLPEGKSYEFGQKWGARTDPPHHAKMQKHTHVTQGGHDVWIVNTDGTDMVQDTAKLS